MPSYMCVRVLMELFVRLSAFEKTQNQICKSYQSGVLRFLTIYNRLLCSGTPRVGIRSLAFDAGHRRLQTGRGTTLKR
jgi:hypothetical protein